MVFLKLPFDHHNVFGFLNFEGKLNSICWLTLQNNNKLKEQPICDSTVHDNLSVKLMERGISHRKIVPNHLQLQLRKPLNCV